MKIAATVCAAACLIVVTGIQTIRLERSKKAFAEYRVEVAADKANALSHLLEIEHIYAANAEESAEESAKKLARAKSGSNAAADELSRLRNALSAQASNQTDNSATSGGADDGAGSFREVVRECAGAVQEMASAADEAEARLSGLQDYVSNVCLVKQEARAHKSISKSAYTSVDINIVDGGRH